MAGLKAFVDAGLQTAKIKINNTTTITSDVIVSGSFNLDRYSSSAIAMELGNVSAGQLIFTVDTSLTEATFTKGDVLDVEISLASDPTVIEKQGRFYVVSLSKGYNTLTITALDSMITLDRRITDMPQVTYPIYARGFLNQIFGSHLSQTVVIDNNLYNAQLLEPEFEEGTTYRQVLSKVCECMGANAYYDKDNALHIGWYGKSSSVTVGSDVRVKSQVTANSFTITGVDILDYAEGNVSIDGQEITLKIINNPFLKNATEAQKNAIKQGILGNVGNVAYYGGSAVVLSMPGLMPMMSVLFDEGLVPITRVAIGINSNTSIRGDIGTDDNNYNYGISKAIMHAESLAEEANYNLTEFILNDYSELVGQVDGKAETFYQDADPATWPAADNYKHEGDLWYKTLNGENTTWRYTKTSSNPDVYAWVQQNVPTEVFNRINGKAQIFTSEPVNEAYNVGDLWFDSIESDIKVAMASREAGAYNAADWVKRDKYASARDGLENILRNTYSPEKKSGGWDAGTWEVASGGNGVGTIETVSDSPTTYTDKAFRITDNASGNRDWRQYAMPLDNQRKYAFSAWCRGIGGEVTSQVRLWANQQSTAIATNTKVIGTDWTYIEYEYNDITAWNTGGIQVQFGLAGAGSIEYIDPRFIDRTALKEATDRIQVGGRNLAQKALWGRYAGGTVYSGEWENTTVDGYTITATAAPHDIIGAVCPNVTEDKVTVSFETNATSNVKTYWVFNNPICTLTNVTKYDDIKRVVFYYTFNYDKDDVVKYGVLLYIAGELTEEMTVGDTKLIDAELHSGSGSFRAGDNGYGIYIRLYIQTENTIIYGAQFNIKYTNITLQKNMLLTPKDGKVSFTLDVPYGATLLNLGVGQYPFASEYYIKNLMVESSTKASNWSPAPEDIDKAIDDITVGGTNLLKGTRDLNVIYYSDRGNWKYGAFYKSDTGIIDNIKLTDSPVAGITKGVRLERTTSDAKQIGFAQGSVPVRSGQAVFSVWLKGAVDTKVLLQPYYRNSTEYARKEITITSTEWTRYEVPFEFITAGDWSCGYVYITGNQPIGTELYVCAPKIEYGNKATDWSESPYDAHKAEGGRNLLKKSNVAIAPTTAYALGNYYFGDEKPIEDEVYTIQIKGSLGANRTNWLMPYNSGGSISGTVLNSYTHTAENPTNYNRLFPEDSYDEKTGIYTAHVVWKVGAAANTYLRIYQQPNNTELDPSSIEWIKMEKGYVATDWEPAPEDVAEDINVALTAANGKNKVFHQAAAPTTASGLTNGDTWFDTDDGYKMYTWNGTSWVAEQFGTNAIANLAITNAKIANATIESAKIKSLDAGKITTGILSAITIEGVDLKLGGKASTIGDGSMEIYDSTDTRIARWDKSGLYIGDIGATLTEPTFSINTAGELKTVEYIASPQTLGIAKLTTEVRSGGVYQETMHTSGWHDNIILNNGYLNLITYDDTDAILDDTMVSPSSVVVSSNAAQGRDQGDMVLTSHTLVKGRYVGSAYQEDEYVDALLIDDTVNAPVTEFAKDPLWTDPSSNYLASMLKELLVSSRFVAGETFNFGEGPYAGHITNSSKDLHVFIPFNKNGHGLTVVAANVTMPTAFIVRTAQGNYLNGTNADGIASSLLNLTGLSYRANGIHLVYRLKTGAAFSNSLNNSPVSVMITGSMSITFTKP